MTKPSRAERSKTGAADEFFKELPPAELGELYQLAGAKIIDTHAPMDGDETVGALVQATHLLYLAHSKVKHGPVGFAAVKAALNTVRVADIPSKKVGV